MQPTPEDVLRQLRETVARITAATHGLSETQLTTRPAPKEWSAFEILAHIRGAADVHSRIIARMLAEDEPAIRHVSARTGMKKYLSGSFTSSFAAFSAERAALVTTLESIAAADWSRGATFTATTPGKSDTVLTRADGMTRHEAAHCDQIAGLEL